MSVWKKMVTALRGGVNEAGEAVVDGQALRILDQELRDASEELRLSKDSLAAIMARQKVAEEKARKSQESVTEHESYALQAMDKGDAELARDIATKIADFTNTAKVEEDAARGYLASADDLRSAIQSAERDIQQMKQQVDTVKATENVQRAQAAVSKRHSGSNSKLRTAMDSLERIKERQELRSAQMRAASEIANETTDTSLSDRLAKAGIKPSSDSPEDILNRLRERSASS